MKSRVQGVLVEAAGRWPCRVSAGCDGTAVGFVKIEGKPDLIPACGRCLDSVATECQYVSARTTYGGGHSQSGKNMCGRWCAIPQK